MRERASFPPAHRGGRRAVSAVELILASAIMAAAFIPVYSLMQGNQRVAYLNELQIVARRRAARVLAGLVGLPYGELRAAATGGGPPTDVRFMPPEGKALTLALPAAADDLEPQQAPARMLEGYEKKVDKMRVEAYFHELEPGFGRLAVLVRWDDPTGVKKESSFVGLRFVEEPFAYGRSP